MNDQALLRFANFTLGLGLGLGLVDFSGFVYFSPLISSSNRLSVMLGGSFSGLQIARTPHVRLERG